jgi:hypothetical protein
LTRILTQQTPYQAYSHLSSSYAGLATGLISFVFCTYCWRISLNLAARHGLVQSRKRYFKRKNGD